MSGWSARVLTIFPDMFPGPLGQSLAGRALDEHRWSLDTVDIRQFAIDKHHTVDDAPFGGGPGMVMRADVLDAAIATVEDEPGPLVYLSPRGRPFDQDAPDHAGEDLVDDAEFARLGRIEAAAEHGFEAAQLVLQLVVELADGDFGLADAGHVRLAGAAAEDVADAPNREADDEEPEEDEGHRTLGIFAHRLHHGGTPRNPLNFRRIDPAAECGAS